MTRLLACLIGIFVCLRAAQAPATADKPKDEKPSIEGRVVNSVTGEAVPRVLLTLYVRSSDFHSTESDEKGLFSFRDLNPGPYTLMAQRTGFATQAYGARRDPRNGTPVVLLAGQQVKGLVFKLAPDAVISGRVLDSEGEPMGSVGVVALRPGYQRGERQWLSKGVTRANDLGEFRLAGLAAGGYIVAASANLTEAGLLGTSVKSADDRPQMAYVLTYYPNTSDAGAAMPVGVGMGAETRIGDIRMLKASTVRVSGRLSGNIQGKPIMVRLVPRDGASLGLFAGKTATVQQAGGSFELRGVAPGSHLLSGMSRDEPTFGAQPLQVGEQNIDGLVLQVGPGFELPGVVVVEGKDTADMEKIQVQLQSLNFVLSAPGSGVDEQGKFTLKDVAPDRYLVQVNDGPDGSYVKAVRFGGRDVTAEGLDLTSGVAGSVQVTMSLEAAQVEGVVRDADDDPVAGATLVLVPESRRLSLYREERTGQSGAFSLKGIAPGEYKLLAWEDIDTGAYHDPEFLKKYESKAESLSLKENDRRTVQVKVIPYEALR